MDDQQYVHISSAYHNFPKMILKTNTGTATTLYILLDIFHEYIDNIGHQIQVTNVSVQYLTVP